MELKMTLPQTCIPCPKIEEDCYDWYERHAARCALVAENQYDLVFIGDSITHFWSDEDAVSYGGPVWHEYYDRRKAFNLGFGFDRTQNVLWRLAHGELAGQHPKCIVLNIGTNQFSVTPKHPCDSPEDAAAGILAVVTELRRMFPEAEVIVMAVFPRGTAAQPYQPLIDRTNALVREKLRGMDKVQQLDIGEQFRHPDGSLRTELYEPCLTHLNAAGYRVWAEALEPEFRRILQEK